MLSQELEQNPYVPHVIYPSAGTQITQGQPGQMNVIQTGCTEQPGPRVYKNYFCKGSCCFGWIQIAIGILLIILNTVAISISAELAQVLHGIWGGSLLIMAGVYGVSAGRTKTFCPILTFMLLSILASLICLSAVVLFGYAAFMDDHKYRHYQDIGFDYGYDLSKARTRAGVNATMALLSGVAGILAVISSAMCCTGICCGRTPSSGLVISQGLTGTQPNQQVVYLPPVPGGIATGGQLQPIPTSAPGHTTETPPEYSTV